MFFTGLKAFFIEILFDRAVFRALLMAFCCVFSDPGDLKRVLVEFLDTGLEMTDYLLVTAYYFLFLGEKLLALCAGTVKVDLGDINFS